MHPNLELTLVRHGETEYNRVGRLQGGLDSPLTPEGSAEAQKLGEFLDKKPEFHRWIVSPLGRTRATSRIIREQLDNKELPPEEYESLIREISCGNLEGRLKSEMDPDFLTKINTDPTLAYPQGESALDVIARAETFISKLLQNIAGEEQNLRIILISHGNYCCALGAALTGLGPEFMLRTDLENTGVCVFRKQSHEEYFQLIKWNDRSHLLSRETSIV